jgi:hypothetical protein
MNTLLNTWATTSLSLLFLATITFAQSVQVTPRALLIPPTKPNSAIEAELLVKNVQEDPIEVLTDVIDGPFTVSPDTLRIPPAAQRTLTVVFKASEVQSYEGTLSLQVKDFFKGDKTTVSVRASVVRPQLALHPTNSLAFDSVDTRQTAQAFFTLKNTGEVDAPIDSIYWRQQPTPFQLIEDMPSTLRPGQQVERSITLRSEQGGSFSNQLRIVSADHPPLKLDVSARVNAPLAAVSPLPDVGVQYQTVDIGGSAVRTVTVLNKGLADLRINTAEVTGSGFLTPDVPTPTTLPPGERVEIRIPFQPKLVGQQRGQLRLETDDPLAPDISIPLRGEGQISPPRIEVLNGTNVHFDSVPLGKTQRDHVLLWNRGGTPYTARIEIRDGDGIEFSLGSNSLLLQPGESGKVSIDFSPKEIGLRESTIGIVTEQGERTLRLQGIGQFLKLSPSTVDFGQIAVGETGSQIIELANIGNADLTIDQIRSTSAEFTIYTQMDPANRLVLPANSLRTLPIHVAFSPSSRGTLSGALRIDGFWEEGTETLDVLLNGTGVAAEIEINPTGVVDFGYVVLGETEERTLVATNSGDTILQVEAHPETPEVRVDPATFSLGPGESTRLKVSFSPGALGERLGRVLLVSNDVKDKARPLTFKGQGALKNIDLSSITRVIATRKEQGLPLPINWNNTPIVQKDETKIDVVFDLPDSLREALVGREFIVEWTTLDENYDPKGASQQTSVKIYESSEGRVLAEDINLRLLEKSNRRVRLKVTTRSYPGAPPQSISQILQAGGWKWEFEAKPLLSFLTIRPGRNYEDADGNRVKGKTERLIGLPGIAFAGWHNVDNPSISGIHFTAIGNVLEALSTENSLAVSLGLAVSFYKDQFLFGFGWDVYDTRPKAKRKGSQDYIMTFKYSGLFK